MSQLYRRTPHTWLIFLIFSVFGFVINTLGPITPFLKEELRLSYTVSSLIFSAFAAGTILTGLFGDRLAARWGRGFAMWLGLFGMSVAVLGLALARTQWLAILAAFCTGLIGALLPAMSSSSLADEHGEQRSLAITELNLIAAVSSAAAPLAVGWFALTSLGWRFALVLPLIAALGLRFSVGRGARVLENPSARQSSGENRLPARYWVLWVGMLMAVAVEYCMLFWCADYLEKVAGLPKALAAQAVSLFLLGMILARLSVGRLLRRFTPSQVVAGSILLAAAGFLLYWSALAPWVPVAGLFITGMGVGNQFPLMVSIALGFVGQNTIQATTRVSLASGIAIFSLPLVLGRLADALGIRPAYGVVLLLLAVAFLILRIAARPSRAAQAQPLE